MQTCMSKNAVNCNSVTAELPIYHFVNCVSAMQQKNVGSIISSTNNNALLSSGIVYAPHVTKEIPHIFIEYLNVQKLNLV